MKKKDWPYGDLFTERCSETECDGLHVHIKIGEAGKPPIGDFVTDAAGARRVAAHLCELASEIERRDPSQRPN